ncbi:MAG TPA: helix-turn-helix transcriptional regulator [Solirubrobacterales bacterium]|nr:helix-turn-helix transcriptional regulator [Solirubrobacterales bacterium]
MATDHIKRVGQALRERREELGLSKAAFARTVHADVRTITRYEKGETAGALSAMEQLAAGLKTTEDEIFAAAAKLREENSTAPREAPASDSERLDRIEGLLEQLVERDGVGDPDQAAEIQRQGETAKAQLDRAADRRRAS